MKIRKMRPDEIIKVCCFASNISNRKIEPKEILREKEFFVVENKKNEVIGCFGLRDMSYHSIEIVKLFVLEECRKKGIGSRIIEFIREYVKKEMKKVGFIFATVNRENSEAVKFFKRKGFEEDGSFVRENENEIILFKMKI